MHILRTKMIQSDALSRWADQVLNEDSNNENMVMLADNLFVNFVDTDLKNLILKTTVKGEVVQDALKVIK